MFERRVPLEQKGSSEGIFQRLGLEFAWRIAEDPVRLWRRYLVAGPAIIPLFVRWWLSNREGKQVS
jgi:UDP-N-acetyl-D-mannosaminuronic acid transferase (WecB/TagA/CpsF family)